MAIVVMTVDTEEAWDWAGHYPVSDYSLEHIERLHELLALCRKYEVNTTYFANYAVMNDKKSAATMIQISQLPGNEVGMHIHPWNTPPFEMLTEVRPPDTYLHNLTPEIIQAKMESVYKAHLDAGNTPYSFRGGRYSSNEVIQEFLKSKGFKVDSSVVPYSKWKEQGSPDYSHRDLYPVRIAPVLGQERALWELPLTLGFTRKPFGVWAEFYNKVEYSLLGKIRTIGIIERVGLVRRIWLNFETDKDCNWKKFFQILELMNVPVITLTVHSTALFKGLTPYTRNAEEERAIFKRIERVFQMLSSIQNIKFATVNQAAQQLEEKYQIDHKI
jgi:hypothetical protein